MSEYTKKNVAEREEEANREDEEMAIFGDNEMNRKEVSKEEEGEANRADEEMVIFVYDDEESNGSDEEMVVSGKDEINRKNVSKEVSKEEEEANGVDEEMAGFGKDGINLNDAFPDGIMNDRDDTKAIFTMGPMEKIPIIENSSFDAISMNTAKVTGTGPNTSPNKDSANSPLVQAPNAPKSLTGQAGSALTDTGPNTSPNKGSVNSPSVPATNAPTSATSGAQPTIDRNYPKDSYSFLAIHGPSKRLFFCFGLFPFLFQLLFLALILFSATNQKHGTVGEVDNAEKISLSDFILPIPANANLLVKITQISSLVAYIYFTDSSVQDISKAIQTIPWSPPWSFMSQKGDDTVGFGLIRFSCALRLTQGIFSSIAFLFLVLTSDNVVDIILNFTAISFISELDDCAFKLAEDGEFGPTLKKETERIIEKEKLPGCMSMYRDEDYCHFCNVAVKSFVFVVLFAFMVFMTVLQDADVFVPRELRVQFQEGTGLEEYSGCFHITDYKRDGRYVYDGCSDQGVADSSFVYCRNMRQWILLQGQYARDPCEANGANVILARSPKTDTFAISTSFEESWVSSSGSPLEMYFFDNEDERHCDLHLGDGICNHEFNELAYQYDGGDCCSDTCVGSLCGVGGLSNAFGKEGAGDGFPKCNHPDTVPISITLNSITSSRDRTYIWFTEEWGACVENEVMSDDCLERENHLSEDDWRAKTPENPYFSLNCDGKNVLTVYIEEEMAGQSETVRVRDGAKCTLVARNTEIEKSGNVSISTVFNDDPIWLVNYTVSFLHGDEIKTAIEIFSQHSKDIKSANFEIIPTCYYRKLGKHVDLPSIYTASAPNNEAIGFLVGDGKEHSDCEDYKFIERYAVTTILFANNLSGLIQGGGEHCTWPFIVCIDGMIDSLRLKGNDNLLSIPSEVALLTNLKHAIFDNNQIRSLPPEITLVTGLQTLSLSSNDFTGPFPPEIEVLIHLKTLEFSNNALNGKMPSELVLMTLLSNLDLAGNSLTGTMPSELGLMSSLSRLSLSGNLLTGTMPSELGLMTSLSRLSLDENSLNGTMPSEFGLLASLSSLFISNNLLTGTMPTELGLMTSLSSLDLTGNSLTGTVPTELGLMTSLSTLLLNKNSLNGTMPSEFGLMTSLWSLYLNINSLTGTVPSDLGLLTSLSGIDLGGNLLTGTMPSDLGLMISLKYLLLYNNILTGTIPSELGFMASLSILHLAGNSLIGTMPSELGLMTSLSYLDLTGNSLIGTMPSELGLMTSLSRLDLSGNSLTGTMPSELVLMTSLSYLDLSGNLLTGTVPPELGHLKVFLIDGNFLNDTMTTP